MSFTSLAFLFFASFAFSLFGAAQTKVRDDLYLQALELAKSGNDVAAQALFQKACAGESQAACDKVGAPLRGPASEGLAILQTATDATSARVIVVVPKKLGAIALAWSAKAAKPIAAAVSTAVEIPDSDRQLLHLTFTGLQVGQDYHLQVVSKSGALLDRRTLRALDIGKKTAKIAVASCMDDKFANEQAAMWDGLLATHPDAIFLIGDEVYADTHGLHVGGADPKTLWKRHLETRQALRIFKAPTLVPSFAVWDDHDYGANDGNRNYRYRRESTEIFGAFFGSHAFGTELVRGPGVSFRWNAFGQRFLFLDDRSFRSENETSQTGTHFGAEQEEWLFGELKEKKPTWLISGDQFFGKYHHYESYEGSHGKSFWGFLKR